MPGYEDRFFYLTMNETDLVTGRHLKKIPKAVAEIRALRSAGKRVTARLMDTSAGKAYYEQYAVRHGIQNVKFFDE